MVVGDMQREDHWLNHAGMVWRNLQVHVPRTGLAGSRRGRSLLLLFRHGRVLATAQCAGQNRSENRTCQKTQINGQTVSPVQLQWEWPCSCAELMGITQPSATSQTANSNWMVV